VFYGHLPPAVARLDHLKGATNRCPRPGIPGSNHGVSVRVDAAVIFDDRCPP
jgi:hypothetical protein